MPDDDPSPTIPRPVFNPVPPSEDDQTRSEETQAPSQPQPQPSPRRRSRQDEPPPPTPDLTYTTISDGRMHYLKKDDGHALWRSDIQFAFLCHVFHDTTPAFTPLPPRDNTEWQLDVSPPPGPAPGEKVCFADLYIDWLARSEKTSKALRTQLLRNRDAALSIAMVCLLVNMGRMNTTLCFSPDMKAHLRTYHPIPCLQSNLDYYEEHCYKQLQDAPRLKSILKRIVEQDPNPLPSLEKLYSAATMENPEDRFRTNPISLIFLLSQYAPKVSRLHFPKFVSYHDLLLRPSLKSEDRGNAFLWLMWWYLESDFSESDALRNPFGAGEIVSLYADSLPIVKVPTIAVLTREECAKENVDTEEEKKYGELMRRERKALLVVAEKEAKAKKNNGNGNGNGRSDSQSPAKERRSSADNFPTLNKLLNDNDDEVIEDSDAAKIHSVAGSSAEGRGSAAPAQAGLKLEAEERALQLPARHYLRTSRDSTTDITPDALTMSKGVQKEVRAQLNLPATGDPLPITVQAGAPSTSTPVTETKPTTTATNATNTARRSRPMTQHQLALAETRRQRVEHVLALKRAEKIREIRDKRKEAEAQTSTIARTTRLLEQLPPDYDTDDEGETTTTTTTTTSASAPGVPIAPADPSTSTPSEGLPSLTTTTTTRTKSWGKGGLCPNPAVEEDYGEVAQFFSSVIRKASRRLSRWDWDAILYTARHPPPPPPQQPEEQAAAAGQTVPVGDGQDVAVAADPTATSTPARAPRRRNRRKRSAADTEGTNTPTTADQPPPAKKPRVRRSRAAPPQIGPDGQPIPKKKGGRPSAAAKAAKAAAEAEERERIRAEEEKEEEEKRKAEEEREREEGGKEANVEDVGETGEGEGKGEGEAERLSAVPQRLQADADADAGSSDVEMSGGSQFGDNDGENDGDEEDRDVEREVAPHAHPDDNDNERRHDPEQDYDDNEDTLLEGPSQLIQSPQRPIPPPTSATPGTSAAPGEPPFTGPKPTLKTIDRLRPQHRHHHLPPSGASPLHSQSHAEMDDVDSETSSVMYPEHENEQEREQEQDLATSDVEGPTEGPMDEDSDEDDDVEDASSYGGGDGDGDDDEEEDGESVVHSSVYAGGA